MNTNTPMRLWMHRLTYSSLIILAIGIFTSVSLSAISHILILPPMFYFLIKEVKELKRALFFKTFLGLTLICVSITLSVIFNLSILPAPMGNLAKMKYFLLPLLSLPAYCALYREYLNEKKIKVLIYLFLIATTLASLSGIIALFSGFNPLKMKPACHAERACGVYGMYMTYGYGISLFMVLISGVAIAWKKSEFYKKMFPLWLLIPAFVINGLGLYLSYTRGAWLGYLMAMPFFFFKEHKKAFLAICGVIAIIGSVSVFTIPSVKKTFFDRENSNDQRLAFFETAYRAFGEKPVFGWGYRNFEPNVPEIKVRHNIAFPEVGGHAHNNYLEHLATTGAFGFMALLFFSLAWILESYLYWPLMFPVAISFFVSGQVQYTFGDGENLFFLLPLILVHFVVNQKKGVNQ